MATARNSGFVMLAEQLKLRWNRWLARRIPPASSVLLNQKRIFILPSSTGAAFTVALLLLLLAGINYQNSLAYNLSFLLTSVFIVAILHTYRNLAGLTVQAAGASAVFVGEHGCFRLQLLSGGRAHQAIALGWPGSDMQVFDVAAGGVINCEISLPATQRGWLRPGRILVESRFPLGILRSWSWLDLDQALLVYPRPLAADFPPYNAGKGEEDDEGTRSVGLGSDDFQGLRAYQPGDSKQRLHWKAYSRGQGLLVKDFCAQAGRDVWLDFNQLAGDVETRLSKLCYWVLQLSVAQQPFALRLPGVELTVASGSEHRDACLRALALFGSGA
jgi:uncharacterized protein (DUF58 family)